MKGVAAPVLACALAFSACYYDSTWGQAKTAQQHLAAQSTPDAIKGTSDESHPDRSTRTFRIRFRPNAHYLAQTVDAQRQLADLAEDADRVLSAAIGLHIEVDRIEPWSFDADERLEPALASLARDDEAQDVDLVVGLIGALPRPTDSLHEAGIAEVLGKHIVVRAAGRLGERDAFDRALTDLSDDDRDRLVRTRKRHRAEAVLLHEIGHTLGALHEADPTSLMHPAYDPKMASFGDDAILLMRLALTEGDRAAVARAQRDYVRIAKTTAWASGARDEALAFLDRVTSATLTSATASPATPGAAPGFAAAPSGPAVDVPPELKAEDRDRFAHAVQMMQSNAVGPAYEAAKPLFAAYPNARAVQDLRCQLATLRWLDKASMLAECAASIRLLDAGARP